MPDIRTNTLTELCEHLTPLPYTVFPLHCPDIATRHAHAFASQLGFQHVDTIRINEYAVFRLSNELGDTAIAKLSHPTWNYQQTRQLNLTNLIRKGHPTLVGEPLTPGVHFLSTSESTSWGCTLWQEHVPVGVQTEPAAARTWYSVGKQLATFHTTGDEAECYPWQELPRLARRLLDIETNDTADLSILTQLGNLLVSVAEQAANEDSLGVGLVHGDMKGPNLVLDRGTRIPRIIDLSFSGWGPKSWDLAVLHEKISPQAFSMFAAGYGLTEVEALSYVQSPRWVLLKRLHQITSKLLYSPGPESSQLAERFLAVQHETKI